jgi:phosphopantothenoylcysteine decarboxylase/phosphopantothenate--cysteine ligase
MSDRKKKILLIVTGSVAAFKAAALASKLTQDGYSVRTVLSSGAKEFVGGSTFEGVTRERVYDSTFAPGDAMAHIDLARWADLTLVYPASANTLTKLAQGRADDLVGTLFVAHDFRSPYWAVPAMNPSMFAHPAVVESVEKLRSWGVRVLDSDEGRMACGEVGTGRLIEPEAMLEEVRAHFLESTSRQDARGPGIPLRRKKVLVTAGGTSESIDPVRVLTNVSTGETGVRVANALADAGHEVTLLLAKQSPFLQLVSHSVECLDFTTFEDLDQTMREALSSSRMDILIHAAAVSDYSVERVESEEGTSLDREKKIRSSEGLVLRLKPNPKILDSVRTYSTNPAMRVVSFKLATDSGAEPELSAYSSDYVFYNDASGVGRGTERHEGGVYALESGRYVKKDAFRTKAELVERMIRICGGEA